MFFRESHRAIKLKLKPSPVVLGEEEDPVLVIVRSMGHPYCLRWAMDWTQNQGPISKAQPEPLTRQVTPRRRKSHP